jgi:hypothetical protein
MKKTVSLYVLVAALVSSTFGVLPASAAVPKVGSACSQSGQGMKTSQGEIVCVKSGNHLVWAKRSSAMNSSAGSSNKVVEGILCSATGPAQAKDASGKVLFCTVGGDGKSSWRPQQPGSSNNADNSSSQGSSSDKNFLNMLRIGTKCSTNGVYGFSGGSLTICKNKVVKYALSADIPAKPTGGYNSRPSWYPTLSQILGKTTEPKCAPSSIKFTSPIIPLDQLAPSIPYGAMIGGHVTPIDHAYIGIKSLSKAPSARTESDYVPVTAPADGTITTLQNLGSPTSIRVVIEHGCNLVSVYMVINKLSGVLAQYANELATSGASRNVSVPIKAGDEFARQRDNAMDFNIFDGTSWLKGFENPFSYVSQDTTKPYLVDPLPFFTSEIRTAMENQFQRTSSPRIGKIDYDVKGAASGNWFLDGTFGYGGHLTSEVASATSEIPGGQVNGKNDYSWSHLAIAPHEVDTSKWIFSTGWWADPAGDPQQFLINISGNQPTPDKLTTSSGMVVYQLNQYSVIEPAGTPARAPGSMSPYAVGYTIASGATQGVVALKVNSDNSLTVEINPNITNPSEFTAFTGAQRLYRH